ncbi:hypothetical protein OG453_44060 [Streptomyces sp. NBC_01381]|uniref:hypothetical protein n=1 Tax=Streptomyces sp. NBC_01381 TaxID=2903845 RepID=UPI00225814A4|nr:hypothetical protein [Streptomyces sp. NBC_01381]MCX4673537.1 hypothetical protein [Streptomyces sp. NBC_01381]
MVCFSRARLPGGRVCFSGAHLSGSSVDFDGASPRRLAAALSCPEDDIRPLWRAANATYTTGTADQSLDRHGTQFTIPADAFG